MEETAGKQPEHLKAHSFKPGQSGNPKGRPKGSQSFSTLYRKAISKIAESKGIDPEDFEVQMVQQAITKGFNGDRSFYADTMDRVHGKAVNKTEMVDSEGNTIAPVLVKFLDEPTNNNRDTE